MYFVLFVPVPLPRSLIINRSANTSDCMARLFARISNSRQKAGEGLRGHLHYPATLCHLFGKGSPAPALVLGDKPLMRISCNNKLLSLPYEWCSLAKVLFRQSRRPGQNG